jgi:hypothetical protein
MAFTEDISVLPNQYNMSVIYEWQDAYAFSTIDYAINRGFAIGHFSDIFSHACPGILVNLSA